MLFSSNSGHPIVNDIAHGTPLLGTHFTTLIADLGLVSQDYFEHNTLAFFFESPLTLSYKW